MSNNFKASMKRADKKFNTWITDFDDYEVDALMLKFNEVMESIKTVPKNLDSVSKKQLTAVEAKAELLKSLLHIAGKNLIKKQTKKISTSVALSLEVLDKVEQLMNDGEYSRSFIVENLLRKSLNL